MAKGGAEVAVLAVQGPLADEVMAAAGLPHGHEYMSFVVVGAGQSAAGIRRCFSRRSKVVWLAVGGRSGHRRPACAL